MTDRTGASAPAIDVVIPTWNGKELLQSCLEHLAHQTVPIHTIVVDNGSTDGTAEAISRAYPDVTLLARPENRGFANAVNAGIRAGDAPFVVLLNNDVDCEAEFVKRLVEPMRSSPEVGMTAGLLLTVDRARIDSLGLEFDRTLAAFPRFAGATYPGPVLHGRDLAAASGGAAAYRRSALDEVGLFDEALFAYMEDADLGLRMRAAGWTCAAAPDAVGVHLGSASFGPRSRFQVRVSGASRAFMLRKYGVLRGAPGIVVWTLVMESVVVVIDALSARELSALRGRVAGWRRARRSRADLPAAAINRGIGFREAVRRRRAALG